jgi:ABC-type sugar transport system substrate-binding protein
MRHTDMNLRLVVSQNDAMAVGAKKGLSALATELNRPELANVHAVGIDGHPAVGRRLVDEGTLAATIIQASSGAPAVEWAVTVLNGGHTAPDVDLPLKPYPEPAQLKRL